MAACPVSIGVGTHVLGACIHGLSQDSVEWSQPHFYFNLIYFQPLLSFRGLSESHASWKLEGTGGDQSVQVLKVELVRSLAANGDE